jgi:hypothetical protein
VSSSGQVVAFSSDYGCKEWLKSLLWLAISVSLAK